MSNSARARTARSPEYDDDYIDDPPASLDILPGERIGRPVERRRGKLLLGGAVVVLIALAGAAALLAPGLATQVPGLAAAAWRSMASAFAPPAKPEPPRQPLASQAAAEAPAPESVSALQPTAAGDTRPAAGPAARTTAAAAPAPEPPDEAPPEPAAAPAPLPPPTVDRADPFQVKAAAVGLHPGLSRVLLSRLSSADYRNAGTAIQTALAETPDSAVLVFPRQRTPELALFQVKFVQGAAPSCRRYVVTVTKDGWSTTALPMEKCGLKPAPRAARVVEEGDTAPQGGPARR